jgi:hypothetical protein
LERHRAIPNVTGNIIHLNPDTNTDGDSEREISNTKDRSGCSSSEDFYLAIAQSLCLSDKNFLALLAVTENTYPILLHFLNTSKSLAIGNELYVVVHYAFMFT